MPGMNQKRKTNNLERKIKCLAGLRSAEDESLGLEVSLHYNWNEAKLLFEPIEILVYT